MSDAPETIYAWVVLGIKHVNAGYWAPSKEVEHAVEYRLASTVDALLAERDAEIARLKEERDRWFNRCAGLLEFVDASVLVRDIQNAADEIAAERQRANALLSQSRLPDYLVRRIKHAIQKLSHPVAANPWTADLLNDILAAVDKSRLPDELVERSKALDALAEQGQALKMGYE